MILFSLSAAFVGFVHSLAPGHWLPVVLLSKTRRWSPKSAVLGGLVAASGHIFVSIILGAATVILGAHFLVRYENQIEHYSGLGLIVFGIIYALHAYATHSTCEGHTHHGPVPNQTKAPYLFLFSLGLSPCVAVLPVFIASATHGILMMILAMISFALGVIGALTGATLLVSLKWIRLDHPVFEHFGDVITGSAVALMGGVLFFISKG